MSFVLQAITHLRTAVQHSAGSMPDVRERDHALLVTCLMRTGAVREALEVCRALVAVAPHVARYQALHDQLRTMVGGGGAQGSAGAEA